jgi:Ca-activated chloride channel family protein
MQFSATQLNRRQIVARRGAMLPLIAILLPVLIVMLGFSVDLAFMQNTRAELRAATDVAARAGAIELAKTENAADARAAAVAMAERNNVAGQPLKLKTSDILVGRSERNGQGQWVFTNNGRPFNSVQVLGDRRESSRSGGVGLFFSRLYGVDNFEPTITATSTFMNVDICLVLDRSGSMEGQPLKDLKNAVNVFLDELEDTSSDEQVALASYASNASLDRNLDTDYSNIRKDVSKLKADGMTAIGLGLQKGIDGVMGKNHRTLSAPIIVLMTDGNHNTSTEPIVWAREAAKKGITVHTITFGNSADKPRMLAVANETGGKTFHAANGAQLAEVFRTIAKTLPTQLTQ